MTAAIEPSVALAVPFAWTQDASYDLRLAFASGTSPVSVTVNSGTYRMNLAPSATDFLRTIASKVNTALGVSGRAETCTVSITAAGLVTLTLSAAATWTFTAAMRDLLGLSGTSFASVASVAATYPPRDLYLFTGGASSGWQRKEPIAGGLTQAGGAFAVRSGVVTWADEIVLELIPSDPDAAPGETVTPWEAGSSTLPWSCERLLDTGLAVTCAFARHWQAVRASTSESYDLVTIRPEALSAPDAAYQFPGLTTWKQWTLPMVRTATATRS